MKKFRIIAAITMVLLISIASVNAYAVTESPHYTTTAGTAGSFHTENTYSVTSSTLSTVCGGDIGVYFYTTSVGLQSSFIRSNSRTVVVKVYEVDVLDTHARTREGTFATTNGIYAPKFWSYTYTNSGTIEYDSTPELRLSWKVNTVSEDTSSSIPAGLMEYSYWVY